MNNDWVESVIADAMPGALPILARTRSVLTDLLGRVDSSRDALASALMRDPGLALQVLHSANAAPHRHFRAEIATLDGAVHMLGTQRLQRLLDEAKDAESVLEPARLASYRSSVSRAALAAMFAADWATTGRDMFPAEVALAALLNNLGEQFLLVRGDRRIKRYLQLVHHHDVLPHEADYVALSESLEDLGHRLAECWRLPEMVREAMRARNAQRSRTLGVMLAVQVARYACSGWRHPLQGRDLRLVAELLEEDALAMGERINRLIDVFNEASSAYGLAALQPLPLPSHEPTAWGDERGYRAHFCLAPRADDLRACRSVLLAEDRLGREEVIAALVRGLHRGLGLSRVVFAAYDPRHQMLRAEALAGTDFEPSFNRFGLAVERAGLFGQLIRQPGAVWVDDPNRAEIWAEIPPSVVELIAVDSFFAMTLTVDMQSLGVVYADRRSRCCRLDERCFDVFRELVDLAGRRLAKDSDAVLPLPFP